MSRRCGGTCCQIYLALNVVLLAIRLALRLPAAPSPPDTKVDFGVAGWEASVRQNLAEHGYTHVVGLLNRTEVKGLRSLAHNYCYGEERKALPLSWGGYTVPGFLDLPEFAGARWLLEDARLHRLLAAMFDGSKYRFASHNDIGCDFVGVWHKDILRGPQKKYQVHDLWSTDEAGERHEIYKVLFYLQDHTGDDRSTKVIPGSHVTREIALDRGYTAVHPRLGDAIIIDQRISHSGNAFYDPFQPGRIFMQVGFGKVNRFTDEFERGTVERQKGYQAKMLKSSQRRGLQTLLTDAKFLAIGLLSSALPPQTMNFFADIDVKKHALLGRLIFGSNAVQSNT